MQQEQGGEEQESKVQGSKEQGFGEQGSKEQGGKERGDADQVEEQAGKEQAGKEQAGKEQAGKEQAGKEQAGKEQAGKEQAARPRSTDSPRIPAGLPQELAAVSSVEHSIAEPCNTDAKLSHAEGEGGFEEVRHHRKGRNSSKQDGELQGGGLAASRQPGRILEVLRHAPASAARRHTSDIRVLTVPRPRTRSSH